MSVESPKHSAGSKLESLNFSGLSIRQRLTILASFIAKAGTPKLFVPRIDEQADHSRRALQMRRGWTELRGQLVTRQARCQFFRIKIGGDEDESVMMRRRIGRRRGRAGIETDTLGCSCHRHTYRSVCSL